VLLLSTETKAPEQRVENRALPCLHHGPAPSGALSVRAIVLGLLLHGCAVGPNYVRPKEPVPETFKEAGPWREAAPRDLLSRGNWWELFDDPELNKLEVQAKKTNLGLQVAAARVQQAQAVAGITGSFLYPELNFNPIAVRYAVSQTRPDQPSKQPGNVAYVINDFRIPLYASYEVDLWGRIRRLTEAADAQMQSELAIYYTVLLTLEGDIAQTYFLIRASDEDLRILRQNIQLRAQARDLIAARAKGGLSSELDLARQEAELAFTQAQAEAAAKRRAELENSLAVLVGIPPQQFRIEPRPFELKTPAIPVGMPSDLLERRPDIAAAERRLAARNAEIGVAKAAYFPSIRLTGAIGTESFDANDLFNQNSRIWAIGASLWQPVFNAGRIGFDVDRAKAAYAGNLAVYRDSILRAFQEVESSLSGLRILSQQAGYQATALENANKATQLATVRYKGGLVAVIEVIDAQRASLQAQRESLQVSTSQMLTTVALIKALGGGWNEQQLSSHPGMLGKQAEASVRDAK
jgi:outer membrane protein, multidrug efflux system